MTEAPTAAGCLAAGGHPVLTVGQVAGQPGPLQHQAPHHHSALHTGVYAFANEPANRWCFFSYIHQSETGRLPLRLSIQQDGDREHAIMF